MLTIDGAVKHPLTLTLTDLQTRYPVHHVNTRYENEVRVAMAAYTGVLLWDILQDVGVVHNDTHPELMRIRAYSADDFACIIHWHELVPHGENKPILVAFMKNRHPIIDRHGPLRLVVPGDTQGKRYIGNLTRIMVLRQRPEDE